MSCGNPHLRRRVAGAVAAVLMVSVFSVAPAAASSDKRREVEQIADELERLQEELDHLGEEYVVAIDEKAKADEEVAKSTERLAKMQERIDKLQGNLSKLAIAAFTGGGSGGALTGLFEPDGSPNDAVQKEHYLEVALNTGADTNDELDALLDQLSEEQANLEYHQKQAEQYAEAIVERQADAEEKAAQFTERKAQAEAELGQLLVEEEQRRQEEAAREAQAALAAAQAAQAAENDNSDSSSSGGGSTGGGGSTSGGGGSTDGGGGSTDGGGGGSTPVSSRAGIAVSAAKGQLGVPYVFAAESPGVAFDCSGLTKYAWGRAGVYLPHQSAQQYASLPHVSIAAAQPGDLIFFHSPISHVGIYVGGGQMIHAPFTGSVVSYSTVNWGNVVGVARPG